MPRNIPWTTKDGPSITKKRARPAPQPREPLSLENETLDRESRARTKKRSSARTPSTSPPPGSPDEEYMMEGYEHDDVYIMVEDEFHAVAQIFTRHLHHAEYQRLKKKARDAGPPAFQPTKGMREETKKRMEARALRARQKDTMASLATGVDLTMQDNEEQEDDPWLGTSLAGLMTNASSQKRTALVGLEKIQSSTRAAKGFGRVTGESPAGRREKMSVFDIFGAHGKGKMDGVDREEHEISVDNLGPSVKRAKARATSSIRRDDSSNGETGPGLEPTIESASHRAAVTNTPSSTQGPADSRSDSRFREPSVATRKLFDDRDSLNTTEDISRRTRRPRPLPSSKNRNSESKKGRKLQIADIPAFLV